jgi:hypothetical protein
LAGNTPAEAVENFIRPLRRVVGCLARTVLVASHYAPIEFDAPRALVVGGGGQAKIECRNDLVLEFAHFFRVVEAAGDVGPFRCRVLGYAYDFRHVDGPSVLAFQWHPESRVTAPHAHVGQYSEPVDLTKLHIPTGRVSVEAVARLAIEEFDVEPQREDWEEVLGTSQDAFDRYREW